MNYDILLIGSGPAAASFARHCPKNLSILLINATPEHGKVCAGLLSPDAQYHLGQENITLPRDLFSSPQLFCVRTHDLGTGRSRYYDRSYLNLDRAAFDAHFLTMTGENCTQIKGKCIKITREKEVFSALIRTKDGDINVKSSLVIGADGASSITRRTLFPRHPLPTLTAIQGWWEAGDTAPFYSCLFDSATSPSCSWIFFKENALIFGGAFTTKGAREAFQAQKRKCIEQGLLPKTTENAPLRLEACLVAMPQKPRDLYFGKDGAYLIGEAAGLISPSSLEGISYAMKSGLALATAIERANSLDQHKIEYHYRKAVAPLRRKVMLRAMKRMVLCSKALRNLVLASGVRSLKKLR